MALGSGKLFGPDLLEQIFLIKSFSAISQIKFWYVGQNRHMLVVENQEGPIELQNRNCLYLIEKVIMVTENVIKTEIEENKNERVKDIIKNCKI